MTPLKVNLNKKTRLAWFTCSAFFRTPQLAVTAQPIIYYDAADAVINFANDHCGKAMCPLYACNL